MAVWVVRGGRQGEFEEMFMTEGVVAVGFGLEESIARFASRDDLRNYLGKMGAADKLWRFAYTMPDDAWVVLPRKLPNPKVFAVGRVAGCYEFRPTLEARYRHIRPVNWMAKEIPLSDFDEDFRLSFTSRQTIFTVRKAPNAESRIEEIVAEYSSSAVPLIRLAAAKMRRSRWT